MAEKAIVKHREQLTARQIAFVEEYLRNGFIATRAALTVGYSVQATQRLMKNTKVKEMISKRLEDRVMSANEVLDRLSEQARGNWTQYVNEDGELDIERMVADGKGYLLKGIRETRWGTVYEFPSSQEALKLLARYYRLTGTEINVDARQINFNCIEVVLDKGQKQIPDVIDGEIIEKPSE